MNKTSIGALIGLVILFGGLMFYSSTRPATGGVPIDDVAVSSTTTIRGMFVCLPHKDTSGPQTMECAFGMKANNGLHYALDFSDSSTSAFDLPMDREYSVTGLLVPIEALSTDHWQKYDVNGVIRVSSYKEMVADIPVLPLGSKITLELNKSVVVASTTIKVATVMEESRCPSDVVCIQAGRVVVILNVISGANGKTTSFTMELGKTVSTDALMITLNQVDPYPISTHKTEDGEYRFMISVEKKK